MDIECGQRCAGRIAQTRRALDFGDKDCGIYVQPVPLARLRLPTGDGGPVFVGAPLPWRVANGREATWSPC